MYNVQVFFYFAALAYLGQTLSKRRLSTLLNCVSGLSVNYFVKPVVPRSEKNVPVNQCISVANKLSQLVVFRPY